MIITTGIRRMREGTVFTGVCVCPQVGGVPQVPGPTLPQPYPLARTRTGCPHLIRALPLPPLQPGPGQGTPAAGNAADGIRRALYASCVFTYRDLPVCCWNYLELIFVYNHNLCSRISVNGPPYVVHLVYHWVVYFSVVPVRHTSCRSWSFVMTSQTSCWGRTISGAKILTYSGMNHTLLPTGSAPWTRSELNRDWKDVSAVLRSIHTKHQQQRLPQCHILNCVNGNVNTDWKPCQRHRNYCLQTYLRWAKPRWLSDGFLLVLMFCSKCEKNRIEDDFCSVWIARNRPCIISVILFSLKWLFACKKSGEPVDTEPYRLPHKTRLKVRTHCTHWSRPNAKRKTTDMIHSNLSVRERLIVRINFLAVLVDLKIRIILINMDREPIFSQ